jgi:Zn-dependent protease
MGQLAAARELWQLALNLLPPGSSEHAGVLREVERLNSRLNPRPAADWTKRLGPLGVLLAALIKFKSVALLLLTKGKFMFSMLAFIGLYWTLFGWPFAVGLTVSVLIHEMGHYLVIRRYGFRAELPMFLPGLGAYVKWAGANVDPAIRAQISLAGPLFGWLSGLLAYGMFLSTHGRVWLAVAQFAGWLNLLNLIPIGMFDGGAAMNALGRSSRILVLAVSIVLFLLFQEFVLLLVAAACAYRIYHRDFPERDNPALGFYFAGLVGLNSFLSWFCMNQARFMFGR